MRKIKGHFEQVPLEAIKEVLQADRPVLKRGAAHGRNVIVETPATKTEPYNVRTTKETRTQP